MAKARIVAAALLSSALPSLALWSLATPAMARNEPKPEIHERFDVCSGCKTIFDRNSYLRGEPHAGDLASVDAALEKELGALAVDAAVFGNIDMGPGNRVQSVRLFGRLTVLAVVRRQDDGSYAVERYAVESRVSGWFAEVRKDALHGSPSVSLGIWTERRAGLLEVRCVADELDVIVALLGDDIGSASELTVQWRIDDKPIVSETWPYNAKNGSMPSPRPVPLLEDLLQARRFVVRVRLHGGLDRTMVFPVAGLDEFLGILRKSCSW